MPAPKDAIKVKKWKENISKANIGKVPWNKGMDAWNKGKKFPQRSGENSPSWRGGISKIGNCLDCGKKLKSYPSKYCRKCYPLYRKKFQATKEKHYRWKGGKPKCLDCGKEIDYKAKRCSLCSKLGKKNANWRGGKSFEPYSILWKETLKRSIRQRDGYTCQICGIEPATDCHHIDYDKENCNINNLIILCHVCHSKTNYNRNYWINYFNNKIKVYE